VSIFFRILPLSLCMTPAIHAPNVIDAALRLSKNAATLPWDALLASLEMACAMALHHLTFAPSLRGPPVTEVTLVPLLKEQLGLRGVAYFVDAALDLLVVLMGGPFLVLGQERVLHLGRRLQGLTPQAVQAECHALLRPPVVIVPANLILPRPVPSPVRPAPAPLRSPIPQGQVPAGRKPGPPSPEVALVRSPLQHRTVAPTAVPQPTPSPMLAPADLWGRRPPSPVSPPLASQIPAEPTNTACPVAWLLTGKGCSASPEAEVVLMAARRLCCAEDIPWAQLLELLREAYSRALQQLTNSSTRTKVPVEPIIQDLLVSLGLEPWREVLRDVMAVLGTATHVTRRRSSRALSKVGKLTVEEVQRKIQTVADQSALMSLVDWGEDEDFGDFA